MTDIDQKLEQLNELVLDCGELSLAKTQQRLMCLFIDLTEILISVQEGINDGDELKPIEMDTGYRKIRIEAPTRQRKEQH